AVADVEAVQNRCRADSVVLERLANASEIEAAASAPPAVRLRHRTIGVAMPGLAGEALAKRWDLLPVGVRSALSGAIRELVTNAEKHSGAIEVTVDIRAEGDGLRVVVRDQGNGFSPEITTERGLRTSVRDRLAEEEIDFDLRSAIGHGVEAEMTWRSRADRGATEVDDFRRNVDGIRMIGALLMSSLMAAGGILLTLANHVGEVSPDYVLATLVVTTTFFVWRSWHRHDRLTDTAAATLILVAPLAFLLSGASAHFGSGYNLAWQALAPIFPLFVLVAGKPGRWVAAGVGAYSAVATTAALALAQTEAATATTFVILATGLVWLAGWGEFNRQLRRVATRAVSELEATARADEEAEARATAALIRARWRLAGIESTADLLHELSTSSDVISDDVRRRCLREETYLREVILLPPELVNIGAWFCQALSIARDREVDMKVRSGSHDVPARAAERLGQYLVDATAKVEPGTTMIASLFDADNGPEFRLVADDSVVAVLAQTHDWGTDLAVEINDFASQVLIQAAPR
ncbi:MAG TPA: ATP-binding protein, partial [Marmoricola sp.]|nr:ATP-binding protein [Marmoricola sp.]